MKYFLYFFPFIISFNLLAQNNISVLVNYRVKYFRNDDTTGNVWTITEYVALAKNCEMSYAYVGANNFADFNKTDDEPLESNLRFVQQYQNLKDRYFMSLGGTTTIGIDKGFLLLKDTMAHIHWKFLKKSKIIQSVECFSAQAEYRGRVWTAWYAPSIPISSGPWLLYGLPGMILEAEDMKGAVRIKCLRVNVEPPVGEVIKTPFTNKKAQRLVSAKELKKIFEKTTIKEGKKSKNFVSFGISDFEIYDFEKDFKVKRFQQKLSDTQKK